MLKCDERILWGTPAIWFYQKWFIRKWPLGWKIRTQTSLRREYSPLYGRDIHTAWLLHDMALASPPASPEHTTSHSASSSNSSSVLPTCQTIPLSVDFFSPLFPKNLSITGSFPYFRSQLNRWWQDLPDPLLNTSSPMFFFNLRSHVFLSEHLKYYTTIDLKF